MIHVRAVREIEWNVARAETAVPRSEPATPLAFQMFGAVLGDPDLLPDAYPVALHGEHLIAQAVLFSLDVSGTMDSGLTGDTAACRGHGVATVLKVATTGAARKCGAPTIRTENAGDTASMRAINDRLGFARDSASINKRAC